jgi:hypothetical protein
MLIAAISLTESVYISKWVNKRITTLPQNNTDYTTKMNKEEKDLQLSRVKRQSEET